MTIRDKFVDRQDELSYLEKDYKSGIFKFISVIGRRRVGKTRLVEEFIKKKNNAVYFLVHEMNDRELRLSIAERLHRELNLSFIGTPSWETIFEELFKASENLRIILILDEFQRFLNINRSVPSILQGAIDKRARKSKLFLIVMGSSVGMMYKLFDYTSALYGRRTGQLNIQPLHPSHLREWFPDTPLERIIEIYSVFGGTPKYLEDVDSKQTIIENIENKILSRKSTLYSEPEILIKTELPESATYFNILKLISEGKTRPYEIAGSLTIKQTSLGYFLNVLEKDMELIKREVPATEKRERSKKAIYKMSDNFFRFWFRYVYPYKSDIEVGNTKPVVEKTARELNSFIGYSFEEMCKIILLKFDICTPFKLSRVGTWWGFHRDDGIRKELEVDIVALNEETKEVLLAECKWQAKADAKKILAELKEKSKYVQWNNENRIEHYAIFARSFKERIKEPNLMLFDIEDLETVFKRN